MKNLILAIHLLQTRVDNKSKLHNDLEEIRDILITELYDLQQYAYHMEGLRQKYNKNIIKPTQK